MWVGQIACNVYLVWLNAVDKLANHLHIGLAHGQFFNLTRLVERQVEEVNTLQRYIVIRRSGARFTTTDKTFNGKNVARIADTVFLLFEESLYFFVLLLDNRVWVATENLVKAIDEVHKANHFFIANSDVTRRLVSHMHLMTLFNQSAKRSTHRDNIVVGVRREDNHTLRIGCCTFRTIGIIGIRLATRPSCDGVLQVVENLNIGIISRTIKRQEFA